MKIVAISDAHLGQTGEDKTGYYSLLSPNCNQPNAKNKLQKFIYEVDEFAKGEEITLIGVGDILDLSFSYLNNALRDLSSLLNSLDIREFVYVVGNHDHYIWTMECEYQKVYTPLMCGSYPSPGTIYSPMKSSSVLTNLLKHKTTIAYPSYTVNDIVFTHGHLFGGLYTYMFDILKPFVEFNNASYEELISTINLPIIQFIYWLIGEAGGGMGAEGVMEALYADIQNGKKSKLNTVVGRAVDVLLPNGLITGIPDSWERRAVKWACRQVINHFVKTPKPLSSFDRYMSSIESREKASRWLENTEPKSKIVFGHTHIADYYSSNTDMINLGSWLVEPDKPEPDCYVLFIDDNNMEFKKI